MEFSSNCFFYILGGRGGEGRGNEHLGSSAKTLEVAYQYTTPPARAHLTTPDLKLDFFGAAVLRNLAAFVKAGRANDGRNGEWRRRALPAGRNIFVCGGGRPGGIGGDSCDGRTEPGFDSGSRSKERWRIGEYRIRIHF